MGRHSQAYLLTYCGISFMGWSYALVSIIASLVVNRNVEPPSEDTSAFVGEAGWRGGRCTGFRSGRLPDLRKRCLSTPRRHISCRVMHGTLSSAETFQLLGLLDVLNAAVGLVASAPLTAFLQWAGRSNVLFGVLPLAPPEVTRA